MRIVGTDVVTTASGTVLESSTVKGLLYSDIAIAGAVTVYTHSISLKMADFFAVSYTAASVVGGIDLKIEFQESWILPATEGAADTYWAEPTNMSDIVTALTTESTIYHQALAPIPMAYGRFKITGAAGNSADTILNMWIHKQEEVE